MTEAYPLRWPDGWPRRKTRKGHNAFGVTPEKAYSHLMQELRMLGARSIVVSTNLPISKRYGTPLLSEDGAYLDTGVAVYFELEGRRMTMAQDMYDRAWANIRSLGLAVSAMRALERHGGGQMMQRAFDGFAALPPPNNGSAYTKRPWREVLGMPEGSAKMGAVAELAIAETFYRNQARELHPDAPNGDAEKMAELNLAVGDAREELKAQ